MNRNIECPQCGCSTTHGSCDSQPWHLKPAAVRLDALRGEILGRRTERPTVERFADSLDEAAATNDTYRTASDREHDTRMLHAIEAALDAIQAGDYGVCTDCETAIPPKRLAAVPWATKCVQCAERAERDERVAA
jgi:RNA polymerase-binding protein DksA